MPRVYSRNCIVIPNFLLRSTVSLRHTAGTCTLHQRQSDSPHLGCNHHFAHGWPWYTFLALFLGHWHLDCFFFFFFFFHYWAQTSLKFTILCLSLPTAGITRVYQLAQCPDRFLKFFGSTDIWTQSLAHQTAF
jgi:hypothetical protein